MQIKDVIQKQANKQQQQQNPKPVSNPKQATF